jgi:hypothetical protein
MAAKSAFIVHGMDLYLFVLVTYLAELYFDNLIRATLPNSTTKPVLTRENLSSAELML